MLPLNGAGGQPLEVAYGLGGVKSKRFTLMAPWLVCRVATDVGDVIAPLWHERKIDVW